MDTPAMPRMTRPFFRTQKNCWYAKINGKLKSLGVYGNNKARIAFAVWIKLLAENKETSARPSQPESVSLIQLTNDFLADSKGRVLPSTHSFYQRFLCPFANKYPGRKAHQISATEIHDFATKPTWSNSTRHDAITTISTMLRWHGIKIVGLRIPPKESKGISSVIPEREAMEIINAAKGDMGKLLQFLWLTGCRPSEALNLQADMVDLKHSLIVLREHKTSRVTRRPRIIYLSADARSNLLAQAKKYGSGFLFRSGNGKPYTLNNANNILWRLNRRFGTKATLYGFRHSFATDGLANGVPETHMAELLGHKSTRMLSAHYSHLGSKPMAMRAAVALFRK